VYEPDDTPAQAHPIVVNGAAQMHNLYNPAADPAVGDVDWIKFTGQAGTVYTIETFDLAAPTVDTLIYLYAADGVSLIAWDDDSGGEPGASRIVWTASSTGPYYVKILNYQPSAHVVCASSYQVRVTAVAATPTPTPTLTATPTPTPWRISLPIVLRGS
jgi:hypothetical protein